MVKITADSVIFLMCCVCFHLVDDDESKDTARQGEIGRPKGFFLHLDNSSAPSLQ